MTSKYCRSMRNQLVLVLPVETPIRNRVELEHVLEKAVGNLEHDGYYAKTKESEVQVPGFLDKQTLIEYCVYKGPARKNQTEKAENQPRKKLFERVRSRSLSDKLVLAAPYLYPYDRCARGSQVVFETPCEHSSWHIYPTLHSITGHIQDRDLMRFVSAIYQSLGLDLSDLSSDPSPKEWHKYYARIKCPVENRSTE